MERKLIRDKILLLTGQVFLIINKALNLPNDFFLLDLTLTFSNRCNINVLKCCQRSFEGVQGLLELFEWVDILSEFKFH